MRRTALLAAVLAASPLAAHDFWLEPADWRPDLADRVAVTARVGDGFRGDRFPRRSSHIERLVAADDLGERSLFGVEGAIPTGWLSVRTPGLQRIGYESRPSTLELGAVKFESYLSEEGLDRIVGLRAERGESERPGREAYRRCAMTLLVAGGGVAEGYDRPIGLALELVPAADPSALAPERPLPVRLLFRGEPLAGSLVTAIPRGRPDAAVSARTDTAGWVDLPLVDAGEWLVKAVHMEEAGPGLGVDWESWWASLTFARPGD